MTETELRTWATSRKGSGDAVAEAVLCLFQKSDELEVSQGLRCMDYGHYFPGGQERCHCGRHTRTERKIDGYDSILWADGGTVLDRAPVLTKEKAQAQLDAALVGIGSMLPFGTIEEERRKFNGSTGTPTDGKAGHIMSQPPGSKQ